MSNYTNFQTIQAPNNTRIAIVKADFNKILSDELKKNCTQTLLECSVDEKNISEFLVPGSLEIPGVVKQLQHSKKFDAIITLGIVIRGGTNHYEIVTEESSRALMNCTLESNIPVINGVLGGNSREDIEERMYKGKSFALGAVQMIKLQHEISKI